MNKIFLVTLLALSVLVADLSFAQDEPPARPTGNPIWIGKIRSFRTIKQNDKTYLIVVELIEDITDGKFEPFDEGATILPNFDKESNKVEIIFDGVSPDTFKKFSEENQAFMKSIKMSKVDGSYSYPKLQLTRSGKKIESTRLTIESGEKIQFFTMPVNKTDSSKIQAYFVITTDLTRKAPGDSPLVENAAELKASDFENIPPAQKLLPQNKQEEEAADNIAKQLAALSKMSDETFVTMYYPVRYADPDRLSGLIRHKLSLLGTITVDNDNSMLLITDQVKYVRSMADALTVMDRRTPQIQIEVRIVEIIWDSELNTGVDWGFLKSDDNDDMSGTLSTSDGDDFLSGPGGVYSVFSRVSGGVLKRFTAKVNLLIKEGQAEILARPKVVVMNNRTAKLEAGARIPYLHWASRDSANETQSRSNRTINQNDGSSYRGRNSRNSYDGYEDTSDAGNTTSKPPFTVVPLRRNRDTSDTWDEYSSDSRTADNRYSESYSRNANNDHYREDFLQTGINLTVTPQIKNSEDIILKINPSYDEITGFSRTNSPILSHRSFQSEVRVRNGDTIVIAGLIRDKNVRQEKGVPGIRRIPLFGRLFKSNRHDKVKTEILFILTPKVID